MLKTLLAFSWPVKTLIKVWLLLSLLLPCVYTAHLYDITALNSRVECVCVWFTVLPVPGLVWSVAVQCSAAFVLSPSPPHLSPSPALHSSSSALSSLPPAFLCGSSTTGGTHLHLPQATEKDTKLKEQGMNESWWKWWLQGDGQRRTMFTQDRHQAKSRNTPWYERIKTQVYKGRQRGI